MHQGLQIKVKTQKNPTPIFIGGILMDIKKSKRNFSSITNSLYFSIDN